MNKDAREVLQEEINESSLRLKQAKFGHKLTDIVPDHSNNYYLPDKSTYFPKDKKSMSLQSSNANMQRSNNNIINLKKMDPRATSSINNDKSSMFITEPPTAMTAIKKQQFNSVMRST